LVVVTTPLEMVKHYFFYYYCHLFVTKRGFYVNIHQVFDVQSIAHI